MSKSGTLMDGRTDVAALDGTSTGRAKQVLSLLGVMIVALLPAVLNPLGIAGDYPNHLARVYIEQELAHSAALQEHFSLEWGVYPDLAMDLLMGPLMPVLGPYTAGAAFNVIALAMLPVGVTLLSWVTTRRLSLLPAASVLLIYGVPAAMGFINYIFAMGGALILFAGWLYMRPGWPRTGIFVPLMLLLFFSHILGFLLFCLLVLAYEIGEFLAGRRESLRQFAARLLLRDGLVTALPIILFAISFEARLTELEGDRTAFGGLVSRITAIIAPFFHHGGQETVLLYVGFYGCLLIAFVRGWIVLQSEMRPVFLATVVLVLVTPATFLGIDLLHIRFGAIPAAVLLGGASLTLAGQSRIRHFLVAFALLFAVQQVAVHVEMAALDRQQRQVRDAVNHLPRGSRVLIGASDVRQFQPLLHTASLVVIEVDGYVPTLFTNTSPVAVSSVAAPIHRPQAVPVTAGDLIEGQSDRRPALVFENGQDDYFHGWPFTFDALLWLSAEGAPAPRTKHLSQIVRGGGFRLYSIAAEGMATESSGPTTAGAR